MNLVGRMADALNEVASIVKESQQSNGFGVMYNPRVDFDGPSVQVYNEFFIESFQPESYIVNQEDHEEFPVELVNETYGVIFRSLFTAAKIIEFKETHPDHFEYIQKELQHE